jgi:ferric-dicitrate binding protein FerR (iron transport regulator)
MEENYELAKWLSGEMTESELKAFQSTPEYNTYAKIAAYSSQLEVPGFEVSELYKKIVKERSQKGKVISLKRHWLLRIAAVIVIGLGLLFVMENFTSQKEVAYNGKKTTFNLPDNSEVVLNSGSEIEYKKWGWKSNRKLDLKGEAYFRVAKGRKFEVETNLGKVTVLGTQFDVKARNNRFDVVCYEGRVKVNYNDKQIVLTPGKSVIFVDGKQINSKSDVTKPEWLENKIAFNNENLSQIVDEIQRQYNVSIDVKSNFSDELFTGKIPNNNLDIALEIIATTYHLEIKKISTNKIIFEGE